MRPIATLAAAALPLVLALPAPAQDAATPAAPAAPAAAPGAPVKPAAQVQSADDLLFALEKADQNIRTLSAEIQYTRVQTLAGDIQMRMGKLYFKQGDAPNAGAKKPRSFAVHFDTLFVDDRRQDDPQIFIFDGLWFVEKRPASKLFTKREVARPGDSFDPLKVGEGPMPLPIGQKAADITAKYQVDLVDPTDGLEIERIQQLVFLPNTWELKLTPHTIALLPGQPAPREEFKEIRLWYQKDTLLPRMARTLSRGGDESFVVLRNLETNKDLPAEALDAREPAADAGWVVQVETLAPAGGAAAGGAAGGASGGG